MLVYKFGGASVKDAAGVINLANIIKRNTGKQLLIVVSAMGKTTNALEELTKAYATGAGNTHELLEGIKQYHYEIISGLFGKDDPVYDDPGRGG